MKGDKERVLECTTSAFDGLIAMVKPEESWVVSAASTLETGQTAETAALLILQARYQRVGTCSS